MSISPVALAVMALGGLIFLAGAVIANVAVLEMSRRLNAKYPHSRRLRWWDSIGNGGSFVIREYRQVGWKDRTPEVQLRFGYQLVWAGLTTLLVTSLIGQFLRGKV